MTRITVINQIEITLNARLILPASLLAQEAFNQHGVSLTYVVNDDDDKLWGVLFEREGHEALTISFSSKVRCDATSEDETDALNQYHVVEGLAALEISGELEGSKRLSEFFPRLLIVQLTAIHCLVSYPYLRRQVGE